MAHGVLPIVSSTAGVAELIRDGENGLCFDRKRSAFWSLLQTMKNFLSLNEDEVLRLKTNALTSSHAYTWQGFGERLLDALFPKKNSTHLEKTESESTLSC
jgi:glycosyltransferase involved in cell wall biosynthesis